MSILSFNVNETTDATPAIRDPSRSALVLIDFQEWIVESFVPKTGRAAARRASKISADFRRASSPVVHVRYLAWDQSDGGIENSSTKFVEEVSIASMDTVVTKHGQNAFEGTRLAELLARLQITRVFYAGVVAEGGVEQTVLNSIELGLETIVLSEAVSGISQLSGERALARMNVAGAVIDR
ncbi:cysteine hydrolase family protein [Arthrobacter sp. TMN-49]